MQLTSILLLSTVKYSSCEALKWFWKYVCVERVSFLLSPRLIPEACLTLATCWRKRPLHAVCRSANSLLMSKGQASILLVKKIFLCLKVHVSSVSLTFVLVSGFVLSAVAEQLGGGSGFQGAAGQPVSVQTSGQDGQSSLAAGRIQKLSGPACCG